VKEILQR